MKTLILATIVSLTAAPAIAAESTVEMLNSKNGENLVFSEKFTKVTEGGTVTFRLRRLNRGTTLNSFRAGSRKAQKNYTVRWARMLHIPSMFPASIWSDARHITGWAWLQ
jgi:hypothetical protein